MRRTVLVLGLLMTVAAVQAIPSPNIPVATDPGLQHDVAIAVDPNDYRHMVIAAESKELGSGDYWLATYATFDGGMTWQKNLMRNVDPTQPEPEPGQGLGSVNFNYFRYPSVAFGADGHLYLAMVAYDDYLKVPQNLSKSAILVARSTDGGLSFDRPTPVAQGFVSGDPNTGLVLRRGFYFPSIAVGPTPSAGEAVYVAYVEYGTVKNIVWGSVSLDAGATWAGEVPLSEPHMAFRPALAVGPDGTWYAAWYENAPTKGAILIRAGVPGTLSLGPPGVVELVTHPLPNALPGFQFQALMAITHPTLAVDDWGQVYVAWSDFVSGHSDLVLKRSRPLASGGLTAGLVWDPPVRIPDVSPASHQILPRLAASVYGRIDLAYYELQPGSRLLDVFLTSNEPWTLDFGPPVRVTDVSSYVRPDESFVTHYLGVASGRSEACVAWTDLRNEATAGDVFMAEVPVA